MLNITPANDKPGDQSNAPDVVHYRNIGGGVARISSVSAERHSSSAVQADSNAVRNFSGAEQYARVAASYTHLVFEARPHDEAPSTTHRSYVLSPAQSSAIYSVVVKTPTGQNFKAVKE